MKSFFLFLLLFCTLSLSMARPGNWPVTPLGEIPGLAITLSPVSTTYSEGQSVTVTVTGGTVGNDYLLQLYNGNPINDVLVGQRTIEGSDGNTNTIAWPTVTSSKTFVVTFTPGSAGTNRILSLNNYDLSNLANSFTDVASSAAFEIKVAAVSTAVYVTEGGAGAKDGSSWANAYDRNQVQTAIDRAATFSVPVWIAQGTYVPNTAPAGCTDCTGPRYVTFRLHDGVKIYGGFPPTGNPAFADRNPATYPTVLSGELGAPDLADNAYHVVLVVKDATGNATLDGLTVSGGYADPMAGSLTINGENIFQTDGGGIYAYRSALNLNQVVLTNNTANKGGGMWLYFDDESPLRSTITSCTFIENVADAGYGGGLSEYGTATLIKDTKFLSNRGENGAYGGAFYAGGYGGTRIENCVFEDNTASKDGYGGAIYMENYGYTLINGQFRRNTAVGSGEDASGGAIYDDSEDAETGEFAGAVNSIQNCVFENNGMADPNGEGIYYGGAIYFTSSLLTNVSNCTFTGNAANQGGAVYGSDEDSNLLAFSDCLFNQNSAFYNGEGYGGAVYAYYPPSFDRCTFAENITDGYGGALYHEEDMTVTNSLFVGNQAPYGAGIYDDGYKITLTNCTLAGNQATEVAPPTGNGRIGNRVSRVATPQSNVQTGAPRRVKETGHQKDSPARVAAKAAKDHARQARYLTRQTRQAQARQATNSNARVANTVGEGGGIYNNEGIVLLTNTILWGNTAAGAGIATEVQLFNNGGSSTITNSLLQDGLPATDNTDGGGNLSTDPLFLNAADPDGADDTFATADDGLILTVCSPALNKGNNSATTSTSDLAGQNRTFGVVDMGAYELQSAAGSLTITITPKPSLTITSGGSITLTASGGSGQPANSYTWSTGESATAITVSNVTSATAFSVTGVTDGCSGTATVQVTVTSPCALTATITPNPGLTICANAGGLLMASGAGVGGTYRWSTNANTPTISVNTAGPYTVTATSASGCSATATVTVSVANPAPLVQPVLSASSIVACEGGAVSVSATVSGTLNYQWYRNGVSLGSAQQGPVLSLGGLQPSQSGSYVLVIQADGCASATSTAVNITVNPLPTVTITFPSSASVNPAGPVITVPVGQGLNYQVFGGGSNGRYERKIIIDRINGFEIRTVLENRDGVFPIDRAGPYTITVTDGNGCSRTVTGVIVGR